MIKDKPIFLVDMDSITVDMTKTWIQKYYDKTGDLVVEDDISVWNWANKTKYPDICNSIIEEEHYFANLDPIVGAVEYATKLMEKGVDFLFLTQPPRKSDWAVRDKRLWIQKHFPKFEMKNAIFAHRKEIILGDLLFDDSPEHLFNWSQKMTRFNVKHVPVTIDYKYNRDAKAHWRMLNKETAWKEFHDLSCDYFNL